MSEARTSDQCNGLCHLSSDRTVMTADANCPAHGVKATLRGEVTMEVPSSNLVSRLRAKAAKGGVIPIHDVTIEEAANEIEQLTRERDYYVAAHARACQETREAIARETIALRRSPVETTEKRLNERIITAISHLEVGDRSQALRVLHDAVGLPLEPSGCLDCALAIRSGQAGCSQHVKATQPQPDHLKPPVKAGDPCPAIDDAHTEHKGKCVYCGAPMAQAEAEEPTRHNVATVRAFGTSIDPEKASERPHVVNHAGDCESYCWCRMQPSKAWEPTTVEILEYARRYSLSTEEARKILKAEHASGINAVKAIADLPACECLVRNKALSAYHNVKCPRYVADLL